MAGFEPRHNNRGNWACPYCTHRTWKSKIAAENHIKREHEQLAKIDEDRVAAERKASAAQSDKWRAENESIRLQRELDEANKKAKTENKWWVSGQTSVYCSTERIVFTNVRMPYGVTPEDTTCHSCGNCTLHMVNKII